MKNPVRVYDAIDAFLKEKGYQKSLATKEIDGHKLREWITQVRSSVCATNPDTSSAQASISNLLNHMKNVQDWVLLNHTSALEAGGYPPDYVKW